ncbi:MAG: hypothetical protein ACTSSK_01540 [Candidatus Heimdallarchaeota archaeon]
MENQNYDKDTQRGICQTKSISHHRHSDTKEVIRTIQRAVIFGIDIKKVDFKFEMDRMRKIIYQ